MALCKLLSNCYITKTTLNLNRSSYFNTMQVMTLKKSREEKLAELKIPPKPKKPLSPYMKFLIENRPKLVQQNPNLKATQVVSMLADNWRELSDENKKKYAVNYTQELHEHALLMAKYKQSLTPEQHDFIHQLNEERKDQKWKTEQKKKMVETNKPKRPLTAYTRFVMDRATDKKNLISDMKSMKPQWDALPAEEKEKYVAAYEQEKAKFDAELVKWERKMIDAGEFDLVRQKVISGSSPYQAKHAKKP